MDSDEINHMVSDDLFDEIKNLNLDGLQYHLDKEDELNLTIKMQFAELVSLLS